MTAPEPDCLCGRTAAKGAGDTLEIGDTLGHGMEFWTRTGRVIGFLKTGTGMRILCRRFRQGDGGWPTGHYYRTGMAFPWYHDHPTQDPGDEQWLEAAS